MAREPRRRRARRNAEAIRQLPWREVVNPYAPVEVLSADEIEAIHQASLGLLENTGMRVLEPGARDRFRRAGATVDEAGMMVRLDRGLVEESVARAPAEFTLHARNPERNVVLGGNRIVFGAVGGPVYANDLDRGRRPGGFGEMCDFMRIVQSLNVIHQDGGGGIEPLDVAPEVRHIDVTRATLELMDKTFVGWAFGRERTEDIIDLTCIAFGCDRDGLAKTPGLLGVINTNSPLQLDVPMAEALITLAEHGQPVTVTPFTLAGAMAPVTIAGALVEQNAEALAGITLAQIVKPGVPVIYGAFTSNVDMKTGAPAFGTPEYAKAQFASGQLARRYHLPLRSSNATASNVADAQAAYESGMSLWSTVMAHTNIVMHAAGWLEGGLTASFEKLVIDAEMLQMMAEFLGPVTVDDDTLGLDAMAEVGPGGHFFGAAHTLARYETAFYEPLLSDWRNFETWHESGGLTATERANGIWKRLLADYEPPPSDPAMIETLGAFAERRKQEITAKGAA